MFKNNLKKIILFKNLDKKELKIISNFLIEKEYKLGDKIFKTKTIKDKLIIIINGSVLLKDKINNKLETITSFKENDFVNEGIFIKKGIKNKKYLEVISPILDTLELSVYNWFTIQKKYPNITNKIYKNTIIALKNRLNDTNNKMINQLNEIKNNIIEKKEKENTIEKNKKVIKRKYIESLL
tara:strand:- start:5 stop:550 length:546 start_codon:yes stop_codon:yes gene_type:complete